MHLENPQKQISDYGRVSENDYALLNASDFDLSKKLFNLKYWKM